MGAVIARQERAGGEPLYLLHHADLDGRLTKDWLPESALRADDPRLISGSGTASSPAGVCSPLHAAPALGAPWYGQGGIYTGIVRGAEGQPDQHVILSPALPDDKLAWQPAMDWAAAHTEGGHTDWALPTRAISSLLLANLHDQFEAGWYWTSEQFSPDAAWGQAFVDGGQYVGHKSYQARARAVRRFNVQSLIHS